MSREVLAIRISLLFSTQDEPGGWRPWLTVANWWRGWWRRRWGCQRWGVRSRQAQLSLLRGEDGAALGDRLALVRGDIALVSAQESSGTVPAGYDHPYHWAPFILIGNGL